MIETKRDHNQLTHSLGNTLLTLMKQGNEGCQIMNSPGDPAAAPRTEPPFASTTGHDALRVIIKVVINFDNLGCLLNAEFDANDDNGVDKGNDSDNRVIMEKMTVTILDIVDFCDFLVIWSQIYFSFDMKQWSQLS